MKPFKVLFLLLYMVLLARSASAVNIYDDLNVSTQIRFSDGSLQSTAAPAGPIGPQGIQGEIGPSGPAGPTGSGGVLARFSVVPVIVDNVNQWNYSDTWEPLLIASDYNLVSDVSSLRFDLFFNVGTYGPNWCTVGVFLDDMSTPICEMSWSGVTGTVMFNNEVMTCFSGPLSAGNHVYAFGHKSQYCHYFNAPNPRSQSNFLSIQELIQ
jgi:hypothetical protein